MHAATRVDAMIFAAGQGTRLRPLTHRVPKPLIPVAGVPMLERVARRLIAAGADRIIINTHHLGEQIRSFIDERDGFGVDVRVIHEGDRPLETGGALRNAASHFRRDAPFFLHNSDVISDVPLERMYAEHAQSGALVTLAVLPPRDERYLLFDDVGLLGLARRDTGEEQVVRAACGAVRRHEFAGIHVASPELLDRLTEEGTFSIFWSYLRLAGDGAVIQPFDAQGAAWCDVGSAEGISRAEAILLSSE